MQPGCTNLSSKTFAPRQFSRKESKLKTRCCCLLFQGIDAYNKEGSKFMQRLVAKQKGRAK